MIIKNTSTLSREPKKILITGGSGAGKTYLAKTLHDLNKCLIISCEKGLLCLNDTEIDVIDLADLPDCDQKISALGECYRYLQSNENKYDTVFLDSLTELGQIIDESMSKKYPDPKMGMVKWGEYNKQITAIIKKFRDLNLNVFMTCLTQVEKDETGRRYNAFQLSGGISNRLPQYFDEVFYLHSDRDSEGNIKRYIQTQSTDQIIAKDRSNKLNLFEPSDLGQIINKIRGVTNG